MKIGNVDIENPLELIECIMAFDSRDWMADKRDRMLYAIVFGVEGCEEEYKKYGYSDDMIKEYNDLHHKFKELMALNQQKEVE